MGQSYHREEGGSAFETNISDIYRLENSDGKEITPEQLADLYFSDPETCFIKDYLENDKLGD